MASRHTTTELIKDLEASGLTQREYCFRKGIPASTLAYHLRKSRKDEAALPASAPRPSFVPVDLKPEEANRSRTLIILKGAFSTGDLIKIIHSGF